MITPSFALTATEMVLPKLSLDFTTASLDARITFARTTGASNPATYVASNGYVTSATNDQARFDYDSVTLVCKGLLIEESRANLFRQSEQINDAVWVKNASSILQNAETAPDNTLSGDKLVEDSTTANHQAYQNYQAPSANVSYAFSCFAKAAERTRITLFHGNTSTAVFDLVTGTASGAGSSIQNFGNGWYRCVLVSTIPDTANRSYAIRLNNGTGTNYTGDGVSGAYIWGAQLEAGAFATSYIPTTTTALTRNADVATITGTAFSGFWRSGPGSILVRALPSTVSGTRPLVQVDDATADNIIALRGNTTNPELYIRAGGSDQATIDAGTISAAAYRLAGAWQAGSAAASLNSGLAVNGAPASIPAVTQMRLGSDGTNYLNGHLQAVEYWPVRLSNASLQNASSTAGYQSIIHPVLQDTIITEPV